jgi:hypothetical protein
MTYANTFAATRSHKASEIAYDLSKSISQTCLIINGGAATALLTFVGTGKATAIASVVPWVLSLYGLGAFASALMMFFIMLTADYWNYSWYAAVEPADEEESDFFEGRANRWHFLFYCAFLLAVGCFFAAGCILTISLLSAHLT